jgi:diguanylate cyclase (GGDEF)-like protein
VLAPEERDPKHRILLSSSLLPHDLDVYRQHCENRRRPFAVAFADMDDFKSFNEALGEVEVDRYVLPSILSAVESASYGHGRAYRFGGDEFVLLLPNADEHVAASLLREVKAAVEALRFERLDARAHMSVGVWITVPDSHLTANELVNAASDAKRNSKALGKSRITIRTECGSVYRETLAE